MVLGNSQSNRSKIQYYSVWFGSARFFQENRTEYLQDKIRTPCEKVYISEYTTWKNSPVVEGSHHLIYWTS